MSVRKTESRLPAGFQASDLGESVAATDGRSALVSLITSPVAARENTYLVFVTDPALAADVDNYEWTFTEEEGAPVVRTTAHGEIAYTPVEEGELAVLVRLLDAGSAERARLTLEQQVGGPNRNLEAMIDEAQNQPGPGAANLEVAREVFNDHDRYLRSLALREPETGDGFQRFVLAMAKDGALQRTAAERKQHLEELAATLNGPTNAFAQATARGAGVCAIRLPILAMTTPRAPGDPTPILDWTELPEPPPRRAVADEDLREALAAVDLDTRVDLFNLARCPKSNIAACGRIVEALRDRYFPGTPFNDVLDGLSGVRAIWIARHLREGPLLRA